MKNIESKVLLVNKQNKITLYPTYTNKNVIEFVFSSSESAQEYFSLLTGRNLNKRINKTLIDNANKYGLIPLTLFIVFAVLGLVLISVFLFAIIKLSIRDTVSFNIFGINNGLYLGLIIGVIITVWIINYWGSREKNYKFLRKKSLFI